LLSLLTRTCTGKPYAVQYGDLIILEREAMKQVVKSEKLHGFNFS
jgi:hypothetical protein